MTDDLLRIVSEMDGSAHDSRFDCSEELCSHTDRCDAMRSWAARIRACVQAEVARPRIVCLCGSTRFMDYFHEAGWQYTLDGWIVLSVGVAKYVETPDGGHAAEALGDDVAEQLDELHLRKIDLADRVFVLNVGGYIGESTRREIEYATKIGKEITYLEPRRWPFTSEQAAAGLAAQEKGEGE